MTSSCAEFDFIRQSSVGSIVYWALFLTSQNVFFTIQWLQYFPSSTCQCCIPRNAFQKNSHFCVWSKMNHLIARLFKMFPHSKQKTCSFKVQRCGKVQLNSLQQQYAIQRRSRLGIFLLYFYLEFAAPKDVWMPRENIATLSFVK